MEKAPLAAKGLFIVRRMLAGPGSRCSLPTVPNGTVWNLAAHPADANFLLASTVNGQVFASADGGSAWRKLPRDFGEVHALAWIPN